MADCGLRTIGLAYSEIPSQDNWYELETPCRDMTLIGICGIKVLPLEANR